MDLAYGIIIGIVYVATPGPISVETLKQGMKGGFIDALAVQAGSSIGLIVYALLALLGAGLLFQAEIWRLLTSVSGITVLFYLGITTILDGRKLVRHPNNRHLERSSARRAFSMGAILSLTSPLDFVFWLSISSRLLLDTGLQRSVFWGGLFAGCILSAFIIAFFAGFWQSRLSPKALLAISWTCGIALISFGVNLGLSVGKHIFVW
jgi:threonine/homoserine/homoserine lactone efflux protein